MIQPTDKMKEFLTKTDWDYRFEIYRDEIHLINYNSSGDNTFLLPNFIEGDNEGDSTDLDLFSKDNRFRTEELLFCFIEYRRLDNPMLNENLRILAEMLKTQAERDFEFKIIGEEAKNAIQAYQITDYNSTEQLDKFIDLNYNSGYVYPVEFAGVRKGMHIYFPRTTEMVKYKHDDGTIEEIEQPLSYFGRLRDTRRHKMDFLAIDNQYGIRRMKITFSPPEIGRRTQKTEISEFDYIEFSIGSKIDSGDCPKILKVDVSDLLTTENPIESAKMTHYYSKDDEKHSKFFSRHRERLDMIIAYGTNIKSTLNFQDRMNEIHRTSGTYYSYLRDNGIKSKEEILEALRLEALETEERERQALLAAVKKQKDIEEALAKGKVILNDEGDVVLPDGSPVPPSLAHLTPEGSSSVPSEGIVPSGSHPEPVGEVLPSTKTGKPKQPKTKKGTNVAMLVGGSLFIVGVILTVIVLIIKIRRNRKK